MRPDAESYYAGNRGIATLVLGTLLPPAAWFLHIVTSFTLATVLCDTDSLWVLHLVTVAALGISLAGGFMALRNWHATGDETNPDEAGTLARSRFLALAGLASCAFFTVGILVAEGANLMLGPCTG